MLYVWWNDMLVEKAIILCNMHMRVIFLNMKWILYTCGGDEKTIYQFVIDVNVRVIDWIPCEIVHLGELEKLSMHILWMKFLKFYCRKADLWRRGLNILNSLTYGIDFNLNSHAYECSRGLRNFPIERSLNVKSNELENIWRKRSKLMKIVENIYWYLLKRKTFWTSNLLKRVENRENH